MATIRREPEQAHFTIVANALATDPRLSLRAMGILVRLLTEPPNSAINTEVLQTERPGKEGRDAIRAALRELEAAGYLTRPRRQGPRGRWSTTWVVSSVPSMPEDDTTPVPRRALMALLTHPGPALLAGGEPLAPTHPIMWPTVDEPTQTVDNWG